MKSLFHSVIPFSRRVGKVLAKATISLLFTVSPIVDNPDCSYVISNEMLSCDTAGISLNDFYLHLSFEKSWMILLAPHVPLVDPAQ